ncbi:galectin-9 [Rana temporaria]|uniref:galectin-9 n=1 Tax=Rana temporaria TaxID=8407 RepID=UPI001AAC8EEE|nr:galectin-9 [Rana temporaria]
MSHGPTYNPPVPFNTHFHSGLNDGTLVIISGSVLPSGDRFAVNFQCVNEDIAFHFNPRFDGGLIVCNTKEKSWGKEEHKRELPFHRGQPFEIRILVTQQDYKVSVNRNHVLEYDHRIPIQRVNNLSIHGCVSLSCVDIQAPGGGFAPQQFPGGGMYNPAFPPQPFPGSNPFPAAEQHSTHFAIPYKTNIHGGLYPSKVIVISGAVTGHPKRFHVNLKFNGGTAFHFNPRFDEHSIVRNSKLNDSWGNEERQMPSFGIGFAAGQGFVIEIVCEQHAFRVNVNGKHVCNFNHRVPLNQINTLEIEGDVALQHVQF